jgi:hypothetical protein
VKVSAAWIQFRSFEWPFLECKLDFFGGLELRLWLCLKLDLSFFPRPPLGVSARIAFVGCRVWLNDATGGVSTLCSAGDRVFGVGFGGFFEVCLGRPHRPFALRILRFLSLTRLWWSDCGVLFLGVQRREPSCTLSTCQEYHSLIIMRMVESSNNSETISNVVQFLDSWSSGSRNRDKFTSYVYPELSLCSCSAKWPSEKERKKESGAEK